VKTFLVPEPRTGALRALNYSPAIERIRRAGSSSARPLREVVKEFGPAYGSVFTRLDCRADHGVELITQGDMFDAEPAGRVIRLDSMQQAGRHLVTRGQVLIAGAGTLGENELYGRSIFADDRLAGKYVGPHSMTLHFEKPEDDFSLFTYAWLACPTGVQAIRSTSYGTKILGIRKDLLSTLPVPDAPNSIVKRVASLVRKCSTGREAYSDAIQAARATILMLPGMQEAHEASVQRKRRSVVSKGPFNSICAWNFAAGGGSVRMLAGQWHGRLSDVLQPDGVFNGPRFARVECSHPHGIDFLSQRDVFLVRAIGRRIAQPDISDRLLFVPREALLVGSHGQMTEGSIFGRVELASFAGWRCGVTQDILRVLVKPEIRELAYAFLSTNVGKWLLKSTAVGTSIPSMRIDLLKQLPFPDPSAKQLETVRHQVKTAEAARIAADEAEEEAIRIIEHEVLPQWLA
jgi:hypothetical protein